MSARIPQRSAPRGSTRRLPSDRTPTTVGKAPQFVEVGIDTDGARPHRPRTAAEKAAKAREQAAARKGVAGIACTRAGVDPDYEHRLPDVAARLAGNDQMALLAARVERDELLAILGLIPDPALGICARPGCGQPAQEHRRSTGAPRHDRYGFCSARCAHLAALTGGG